MCTKGNVLGRKKLELSTMQAAGEEIRLFAMASQICLHYMAVAKLVESPLEAN